MVHRCVANNAASVTYSEHEQRQRLGQYFCSWLRLEKGNLLLNIWPAALFRVIGSTISILLLVQMVRSLPRSIEELNFVMNA